MNQNKTDEAKRISNEYTDFYKCSPDIWIILASISQLERDLIADRVKIGLANARAKGKLIGRKKMRDSELIRKLLNSGLTYRAISVIAKCSHGSVHQEKLAVKREEQQKKNMQLKKIVIEDDEPASIFPQI